MVAHRGARQRLRPGKPADPTRLLGSHGLWGQPLPWRVARCPAHQLRLHQRLQRLQGPLRRHDDHAPGDTRPLQHRLDRLPGTRHPHTRGRLDPLLLREAPAQGRTRDVRPLRDAARVRLGRRLHHDPLHRPHLRLARERHPRPAVLPAQGAPGHRLHHHRPHLLALRRHGPAPDVHPRR